MQKQLAYWQRTLAAAPPIVSLPLDRRRPRVLTHAGDVLIRVIPPRVARSLERVAHVHEATPFMTMFAAFLALLHRYSRETDLCVGTGVAARDTPETETLIGMLVTALVLRTDLSGDPTFAVLVERVRTVTLDAYARRSPKSLRRWRRYAIRGTTHFLTSCFRSMIRPNRNSTSVRFARRSI